MINLINNEFIKVKKSKLFFIDILFVISIILINKYSSGNILDLSYNLIPFVGVVISILFSGSICEEVDSGVMKYYLTKPYMRYKIYLSKLISIVIYSFVCISVIISSSLFINNSIDYKYIVSFYVNSIPILFLCNYIMYLSVSFKSQVFVSCFSILTLCFSLMFSQILFGINTKFIEYSFLPYLDFSIFKDNLLVSSINSEFGVNLSLYKGIVINIIFSFIFSIFGIYRFNKKDIKN